MGLFDWLLGKKRERPEAPRSPKVISGLDDDSPHLLVEMDGGNGVMIMDRDQYDYLYGESQAPDPAQVDVDLLLQAVSRVRVLAGGLFRGNAMGTESLIDLTDDVALKQLADALEIIEDPSTFSHCACLGGPTLELFAENQHIATIGLQHGQAIRWSKWKHDARLKNGACLNEWLIENGVEETFLEMLFRNAYDAGGMMPIGFCRSGPQPLSRSEQRVRLAELQRVHGGNIEDAFTKCDEELKADTDLALGYAVRGLILHQMKEHGRSIEDLTQAINRGLQEAELFFSRAVSHDTTGNPRQALKDCTSALEIEPRHINALNSRGLVQSKLGNWNEALEDLNAAIDLAPDWHLPFLNRVEAHVNLDDLPAAISDCNRVIDLASSAPGDDGNRIAATGYWNRSQCHQLAGDLQQAERDAIEAQSRAPEFNHDTYKA